jgi:hypothetical protein
MTSQLRPAMTRVLEWDADFDTDTDFYLDFAQAQIHSMLVPTERTVCKAIRICGIRVERD